MFFPSTSLFIDTKQTLLHVKPKLAANKSWWSNTPNKLGYESIGKIMCKEHLWTKQIWSQYLIFYFKAIYSYCRCLCKIGSEWNLNNWHKIPKKLPIQTKVMAFY